MVNRPQRRDKNISLSCMHPHVYTGACKESWSTFLKQTRCLKCIKIFFTTDTADMSKKLLFFKLICCFLCVTGSGIGLLTVKLHGDRGWGGGEWYNQLYTIWKPSLLMHAVNTHSQTCKHRQTGSSHCSSFVYTLTFSQHLSYVLYTFGKRGPFSNWGPYCSFCHKSPVWMHETKSHTHTHSMCWTSTILETTDCNSFVNSTKMQIEWCIAIHMQHLLKTSGNKMHCVKQPMD